MIDDKPISTSEYQKISSKSPANKKQITVSTKSIIIVLSIIVLCGLSFWGGIYYQKQQTQTNTMMSGNNTFGPGQGMMQRGGGAGEVTSISSTSITISNQRTGESESYTLTDNTTVSENGETKSLRNIATGDTVMIMTSGSSSKTATRILLNPTFGNPSSPDASQNL